MGEALEVAKILVSPLEKLMDIAKKGAGILYEPRHKRKMADATAYEIDVISESLRKNSDVLVTYDKGEVAECLPDFEEFVKRTQCRVSFQEMKNQQNIESVIDKAYDELETEEDVSSESVDEDWIARFFNIVKDVSNEEMHIVWSKILAGEIKSPGCFSMRTLDLVSNMNKREAETFQKIVPFVMQSGSNCFIFSDSDVLKKYGIEYIDILNISECGLINSSSDLCFRPFVSNIKHLLIFNDKITIVLIGDQGVNKQVTINMFPLTQAGKELYAILEHGNNVNFICDFAEQIKKENKDKIDVSIHEIDHINGDTVFYKTEPLTKY